MTQQSHESVRYGVGYSHAKSFDATRPIPVSPNKERGRHLVKIRILPIALLNKHLICAPSMSYGAMRGKLRVSQD